MHNGGSGWSWLGSDLQEKKQIQIWPSGEKMDPDPTLEKHPDPLFYYLPSQWFVAVYELFRAYWRLTIIKSYIYIHILLSKQYIVLFLIKCCFWRDRLSNKNITIFCLNRYWTMDPRPQIFIKILNPAIRVLGQDPDPRIFGILDLPLNKIPGSALIWSDS